MSSFISFCIPMLIIVIFMTGTLLLHRKYTWPILLRRLYRAPFSAHGQRQSISAGYRILEYLDYWGPTPIYRLCSSTGFESARITTSLGRLKTLGSIQIENGQVDITDLGRSALWEFQALARFHG